MSPPSSAWWCTVSPLGSIHFSSFFLPLLLLRLHNFKWPIFIFVDSFFCVFESALELHWIFQISYLSAPEFGPLKKIVLLLFSFRLYIVLPISFSLCLCFPLAIWACLRQLVWSLSSHSNAYASSMADSEDFFHFNGPSFFFLFLCIHCNFSVENWAFEKIPPLPVFAGWLCARGDLY